MKIQATKRGSKSGFLTTAAVLGVLSIAWVGYLMNTPFSNFLPEAASPADQIDNLFKLLAEIGGVVLIYVLGYLLYFAYIFRRRPTDPLNMVGSHNEDSLAVEAAFWGVPFVLVVIISIYSLQIWQGLQVSPGNALTVEAIGHQFFFDFRYPTLWKPVQTEMHLPVDQPVTVKITSADVIHGFWVPEVRLKADMVPGLLNTLRFTPNRVGKYHIICTEFCGIAHGQMNNGVFIVEPQAEFQKWLALQAKTQGPAPGTAAAAGQGMTAAGAAPPSGAALAAGSAADGQTLFGAKCAACHSVGSYDDKRVGPGLGHLLNDPAHPNLVTGEKASPTAISSILKKGYSGPIGMMPNQTQNAISDQDIANLTAYLVSLSK